MKTTLIIISLLIHANIFAQKLEWKQITKSHYILGEPVVMTLAMTNPFKDTIKICSFYQLPYSIKYKVNIVALEELFHSPAPPTHGRKLKTFDPRGYFEAAKRCQKYRYEENDFYKIPPSGTFYLNINYGSPNQNGMLAPDMELPVGQYSIHTVSAIENHGFIEDSSFFIEVHERTPSQQLEFDEYLSSLLKTSKEKINHIEDFIAKHPNGLFKNKAILIMLKYKPYALKAIDTYFEQLKDTAALQEALEAFADKDLRDVQIPDQMKNIFSNNGEVLLRGLQILNKKSSDRALNLSRYYLSHFPKYFTTSQANKLRRRDFYPDIKKK